MPRNGQLLYAPSVTPSGTTYYIRGKATCGGAELVKTTLDGTTNEPQRVRVYFESERCSTQRFDVYSVDDVEPVPPPGPPTR
jgi:hypothetical protein